jgi:hypothetical protein
VGTLGIIDGDTVDRSNLQRQVIHTEERIGTLKVESAAATIAALNPDVNVVQYPYRIGPDNIMEILGEYDIVVDGLDNFPTRYLLNDASVRLGVPVVSASILGFEGQLSVFAPNEGPCYRCLYPEPPPPHLAPSCQEAGVLGILPGGGAVMAAFAAYTLEKKTALRPGEVPFGKGNIRGVAAPEAANNAGAQTSFIPLLTLGIPPNAVMALMVGAMTIHNIQPGPQVMTSNPELFWGLSASMWIGNLMLVILNLPLIGIWIKLLTVPYRWLYPSIVLFCAIGVYSTNNTTFDIWMVGIFGFIGYIFIKLGTEPAPLLLGFILGPMMEEYLRRALLLSRGDWTVFVTRPLSASLLLGAVILLSIVLLPSIKAKREEAFVED